MATLVPIYQKIFPIYPERSLSVTKVKTVSTSDTFTLAPGVHATNSRSISQIRAQSEVQITSVSNVQATGVVTLTTPANKVGNTVTIVCLHRNSNSSSVG